MAKKKFKSIFVILIILSSILPVKVFAADSGLGTGNQERIYGANRYETAAKIAEKGWDQSAYAILAAGMDNNLVDALTASTLARAKDAPVLLTPGDRLDPYAKEQLLRLHVKTVYITSGTGVIQQKVWDDLSSLGIAIIPLGGADRFETAINIAKELKKTTNINTAVVTTALSNADALTVAPIAAANGWPVLLTSPGNISPATGRFLNEEQIAKTYIIGGAGAVSTAIQDKIPNPTRIGGTDRFDTDLKILDFFTDQLDFSRGIYLANGQNEHLADSLSASSLIAKTSSPLILTGRVLSVPVSSYLDGNPEISKAIALGGEKVIDPSVLDRFQQMPVSEKYTESGIMLGSSDSGNKKYYDSRVILDGNDITLQNAVIKHDLYIGGQGCTLTNVIVNGKIYTNPDKAGGTKMDTVQTAKMVVQSYSDNAIHIGRNGKYGLTLYTTDPADAINLDFESYAGRTDSVEQCAVIELASGSSVGDILVERVLGTQWRLTFTGIINQPVAVDKMSYDPQEEAPESMSPDMPLEIITGPNSLINNLEIRAEDNQLLNLTGRFGDLKVYKKLNLGLHGVFDNVFIYSDASVGAFDQSLLKNVLISGNAIFALADKSKANYVKATGNCIFEVDAYSSIDNIDAAGTKSLMYGLGYVNGERINSYDPVPVPGAAENTAINFSASIGPDGTLFPVAGENNQISLTILDRHGQPATDINGIYNVTVSNIIKAGDGSYGSVNGNIITGSAYTASITIPVTFTQGKGNINLVLSAGKGPSGSTQLLQQQVWFKVSGIFSPDTEILTFNVAGYRGYTNGRGTREDPYIISTAQELNALRYHTDEKDMFIKLGADIDLGFAPYNTGEGWVPVDASIKEFDGDGHVIKNLYINRPGSDYQALFNSIDAQIMNVGLANANVTGNKHVAALVVNTQFVDGCTVSGNISGTEWVGGIAASVMAIHTSVAKVNIAGGDYTGGLVPSAYEISNCYVSGKISGADHVGGLGAEAAGYLQGNVVNITVITASGTNVGRLAATAYPGTEIGNNLAFSGMLYKKSADDTGSTAFPNMPGSIGINGPDGENRTFDELSVQTTYEQLGPGWNFDTEWVMTDGQPELKSFIRE